MFGYHILISFSILNFLFWVYIIIIHNYSITQLFIYIIYTMDNISTKKKRKGGQAREKEKNKKLLYLIGQKCEKINSYFKGTYVITSYNNLMIKNVSLAM